MSQAKSVFLLKCICRLGDEFKGLNPSVMYNKRQPNAWLEIFVRALTVDQLNTLCVLLNSRDVTVSSHRGLVKLRWTKFVWPAPRSN